MRESIEELRIAETLLRLNTDIPHVRSQFVGTSQA